MAKGDITLVLKKGRQFLTSWTRKLVAANGMLAFVTVLLHGGGAFGKIPMRNGIGGLAIFRWPTLFLFLALGCIGGMVWLNLKVGWAWWLLWLWLFGPLSYFLLLGTAKSACTVKRDLRAGRVKLAGTVMGKWVLECVDPKCGEVYRRHTIQVGGSAFKVHKDIYCWVKEGEGVIVTFWRHTETVIRVTKHRGL